MLLTSPTCAARCLLANLLLLTSLFSATARGAERPQVVGLWLMGQSLCDGSESLPLVTPQDTGWGNYCFTRGVRTWVYGDHAATPEQRPEGQFVLAPLRAAANGGLGETVANGLADHLKSALLAQEKRTDKAGNPRYLVAYAGQGGRQIQELGPADLSTDRRTPESRRHGGGYYRTSLDDARRAVAQVNKMGGTFSIQALYWMQGEGNGGPTGGLKPTRWDEELPRAEGLKWYRDQLLAYRRQWSADLGAITGQKDEMPMFTYQTLGPAGMAQVMAADEDPHMHLVGPHYAVPSAVNSRRPVKQYGDPIHLSADGERWWGEQVGKVMHRVLHLKETWEPLRPKRAWVEQGRASIMVEYTVPRPPLVVDAHFLPMQELTMGGGYRSLAGLQVRTEQGTSLPLIKVEVASPTVLRITLAAPLDKGARCVLDYGHPNAGALGKVTTVRKGPEMDGQPTMELLLEGDLTARLKLLTDEGAFYVANMAPGAEHARVAIRHVAVERGHTVLRYEVRELRHGVPFAEGQDLVAQRSFTYGNVRDSDPEVSVHVFGDAGYGTRAGQRYPLWNWCVLFDRFPVEEQE